MTLWNPNFFTLSPAFQILEQVWPPSCRTGSWPTLADYHTLFSRHAPVLTETGQVVRCVAQDPKTRSFAEHYEVRIYERGELQTRTQDWHDFFNALTWLLFPQAKAAVNARHYEELQQAKENLYRRSQRSPREDVLTLFHESGVVVVSSNPALSTLMRDFQWKSLFSDRREEVLQSMRFFIFGHALFEKFLHPYTGLTGHSIIYDVPQSFLATSLTEQCQQVDQWLAADFTSPCQIQSPQQFMPFPMLGFPGLVAENESPTYYDNTRYFRPGRQQRKATS